MEQGHACVHNVGLALIAKVLVLARRLLHEIFLNNQILCKHYCHYNNTGKHYIVMYTYDAIMTSHDYCAVVRSNYWYLHDSCNLVW